MVMLLTERGGFDVKTRKDGEDLWVDSGTLAEATGWELKPEGFCRDEICVPLPRGRESEFRQGSEVNAAKLWRHAGQPSLRGSKLESLQAPDVALPDLDGRIHRISDHLGKKIFLSTWASW
jgi:hypothetical protein